MNNYDKEIYYLISKFLSIGPCKNTYKELMNEINEHKLLSQKTNWLGEKYEYDYRTYENEHPNVSPDYLRRMLIELLNLNHNHRKKYMRGVRSLIYGGKHCLFDSSFIKNDASPFNHYFTNNLHLRGENLILHKSMRTREFNGKIPNSLIMESCQIYKKMELKIRILGHLSSVYCLTFDKTFSVVITGSDDKLVKLWSVKYGILLATLRGHNGEICDLSVNDENTCLATGSCDKMVRVWCLKTTALLTVLEGHTSAITSLSFSKAVLGDDRYLLSTGSDGVVCFWKWSFSKLKFENVPYKFVEKSRPGSQILCSSFSSGGLFLAAGSSDSIIRVYYLGGAQPERINELVGHMEHVENIQFDHASYRIASGSKDGCVRIWYPSMGQWTNISMNMTEYFQTPSHDAIKPKARITMIEWSLKDDLLIVAVSDLTIKIFNPNNGQIISTLTGHKDEIYVINIHPIVPNIIISAGHDGNIIMWDIQQSKILWKFYNQLEEQGFGAIYDCKLSKDGLFICATDSHGHLCILSAWNNNSYQSVPKQQFFHTDYRPFINDSNGFTIDEQTSLPTHLMLPSFLVDVDGRPHNFNYQEIIGDRTNQINNYQQLSTFHETIIEGRPGLREVGDIEGVRSSTFLYINSSSNNIDSNLWRPRILTAFYTQSIPIVENITGRLQLVEEEVAIYEKYKLNKLITKSLIDFHNKSKKSTSTLLYKMGLRARRHLQLLPTDNIQQLSPDTNQNPRHRRPDNINNSSSQQNYNDISYTSFDNDTIDELWTRTSESTCESTSVDDDISSIDDKSDNITDENDSNDEAQPSNSRHSNVDFIRERNRLKSSNRRYFLRRTSCSNTDFELTTNLSNDSLLDLENSASNDYLSNNQWILIKNPRRSPYHPQLGDFIYLIRSAYDLYRQVVQNQTIYSIEQYTNVAVIDTLQEQQLCEVIGLNYPMVNPRICVLELLIIEENVIIKNRRKFNLSYHDILTIDDFIILRSYYEDGVMHRWSQNSRFLSVIDDSWWSGNFKSYHDRSTAFRSCFIQWETGEEDCISPWDMLYCRDDVYNYRIKNRTLINEDHFQICYKPSAMDWNEFNQEECCNRLANAIVQFMNSEYYERNSFDFSIESVPYPSTLSIIKDKLINRFYRRNKAVVWDIEQYERNLKFVHKRDVDIKFKAFIISQLLVRCLRESDFTNITDVFASETKVSSSTCGNTIIDCSEDQSSASYNIITRGRSRIPNKIRNYWYQEANELLQFIKSRGDSEPFRKPIDLNDYPEYLQYVKRPMDLSTIQRRLDGDFYQLPQQFIDDFKLIFSNSRTFNIDTRSRIYSMTIRLSSLFTSKAEHFLLSIKKKRLKNNDPPLNNISKHRKVHEYAFRNSSSINSNMVTSLKNNIKSDILFDLESSNVKYENEEEIIIESRKFLKRSRQLEKLSTNNDILMTNSCGKRTRLQPKRNYFEDSNSEDGVSINVKFYNKNENNINSNKSNHHYKLRNHMKCILDDHEVNEDITISKNDTHFEDVTHTNNSKYNRPKTVRMIYDTSSTSSRSSDYSHRTHQCSSPSIFSTSMHGQSSNNSYLVNGDTKAMNKTRHDNDNVYNDDEDDEDDLYISTHRIDSNRSLSDFIRSNNRISSSKNNSLTNSSIRVLRNRSTSNRFIDTTKFSTCAYNTRLRNSIKINNIPYGESKR